MEKSESKKLIPLYLQELFLKKTDKTHYVRMPEILCFLEDRGIFADRRTIYAAISILNTAGFEIAGVQEKGGYKYHHPARRFSSNELKFLIDSVAASKFLTEKKSKELIEKIKSLGSEFEGKNLNRNVLLGKRIKTMNDRVFRNLDLIYDAISENRQIEFQYMRWNRKRELEFLREGKFFSVSPFAVTLSDDNYYLIAYDSRTKELHHYRIDKMKSIKQSEECREGIEQYKSFDIVDYSQKTFNMFGGRDERVSIEAPERFAGIFIDRFGESASIRQSFDNPKNIVVRISVQISTQFFGWLFGLGKDVRIVSPDSVIKEYREMTESVISSYTS